MYVPPEYMFGVDVAMQKLRPFANFQLEGTKFTIWNDPTGTTPPAWEEVIAQLEQDKNCYDQWVTENQQNGGANGQVL